MKKVLLIIPALIMVVGCSTRKKVERIERADSFHEKIVVRQRVDTVYVRLPADSASATLPVAETSELSTSVARSRAWVDSAGRLRHTLVNVGAPLKVPAVVSDTLISREKAEKVALERESEPRRSVPMWFFALALMVVVLLCRRGR